jgi:hypothetical protein
MEKVKVLLFAFFHPTMRFMTTKFYTEINKFFHPPAPTSNHAQESLRTAENLRKY